MEGLYFIAVVPPADIRDRITAIKQRVRKEYGSAHALRSPPHITLHMPFKWKEEKLPILTEAIERVTRENRPFDIHLKDFDCFPPRVIYVDVAPNADLAKLRHEVVAGMRRLHVLNADYKFKAFHPHVTIAFRDLRKAAFHKAWAYYQDQKLDFEFQVRGIELLRHDKHCWELFQTFELTGH